MKNKEETKLEWNDSMSIVELLKTACKRFGHKENYKIAKLYNKNGISLF